jgi:ribonucleotide reductase class II
MEGRGNQPRQWKIVSIEELPEKQYGWCVMEPVTNHFTLAENILVMNTSATIEFRENEIEGLGERIYQAIKDDEGYISAALLARFDDLQTFPRLPFEPINKETYEQLVKDVESRKVADCFHEALRKYDFGDMFEAGPAGCDSDKCLIGSVGKK